MVKRSSEHSVPVGRQRQRTVETEIVGGKMFSAVARVAEGDVGTLAAAVLSTVEYHRNAHGQRQHCQHDSNDKTRTRTVLIVA